jgi:hypothetical protein
VESQWEREMAPSASMLGRERDIFDCMNVVVKHVTAHEVLGTWPLTGEM